MNKKELSALVMGLPRNSYGDPLKSVECNDGFMFRVKVGDYAACRPQNFRGPWEELEIRNVSRKEILLQPYSTWVKKPKKALYRNVPWDIVRDVIAKHGGLAERKLPEFDVLELFEFWKKKYNAPKIPVKFQNGNGLSATNNDQIVISVDTKARIYGSNPGLLIDRIERIFKHEIDHVLYGTADLEEMAKIQRKFPTIPEKAALGLNLASDVLTNFLGDQDSPGYITRFEDVDKGYLLERPKIDQIDDLEEKVWESWLQQTLSGGIMFDKPLEEQLSQRAIREILHAGNYLRKNLMKKGANMSDIVEHAEHCLTYLREFLESGESLEPEPPRGPSGPSNPPSDPPKGGDPAGPPRNPQGDQPGNPQDQGDQPGNPQDHPGKPKDGKPKGDCKDPKGPGKPKNGKGNGDPKDPKKPKDGKPKGGKSKDGKPKTPKVKRINRRKLINQQKEQAGDNEMLQKLTKGQLQELKQDLKKLCNKGQVMGAGAGSGSGSMRRTPQLREDSPELRQRLRDLHIDKESEDLGNFFNRKLGEGTERLRRKNSGKLNMRRLLKAKSNPSTTKLFSGKQLAKSGRLNLSVGLLTDVSGSMDTDSCEKFAGVIAGALAKANIPFGMWNFENLFYRVKGFEEPFHTFRHTFIRLTSGGTVMWPAMAHVVNELRKRPEKLRLLFVITDGESADQDPTVSGAIMNDLRREPIKPYLVGVEGFDLNGFTGNFFRKDEKVSTSIDRVTNELKKLIARAIDRYKAEALK